MQLGELLDKDGKAYYETDAKPPPLFFYLLGGGDDSISDFYGVKILMVATTIWGVLDLSISTLVIYFKSGTDDNQLDRCSQIVTTFFLVIFQAVFSVFELIGLFFNFEVSNAFLLFWPISNILRVVDCVVTLIWRTDISPFSKCWCGKQYKWPFLVIDSIGTNAGFMMADDPFWEKIVSITIEVIDSVFCMVYTLHVMGVDFAVNTCNTLTIIKIIAVSVKIALSLKSYVWFQNYILSLLYGAVFSVFFFFTFLLLAIKSMGGFYNTLYSTFQVPIEVALFVYVTGTGWCAHMNMPVTDSKFLGEDGGGDVDGECFSRVSV